MDKTKEALPVTVDKSHLITIGERLYSHSVELVRELVNNAYDADATTVKITISDEEVKVEDNGSGMDMNGLIEYFKIGSPNKKMNPKSALFKRDRIGQFGIGKFATLSACERFEVITKKEEFAARVTFDKSFWESMDADWNLPLEIIEPDVRQHNGTTVVLSKLKKKFDVDLVRQRLIESVPLKAPDFEVYLNGIKLLPKSLSGHRLPVLEGSKYGPIYGEIVIVSASHAKADELGIEVKVKQVTVRREFFGIEAWGKSMARVRGEINADFLPVTSDRSGFVTDSPEYVEFNKVMTKVVSDLKSSVDRIVGKKETAVAKRAMKEALLRVEQALNMHPDLSPFGSVPVSDGTTGAGEAAHIEKETAESARVAKESQPQKKKQKKTERKKRSAVSRLTADAVVQKLKVGSSGVSCCLDHFGADGPEAFSEGTIIFINRDHPLYQREAKKRDTHILNVARLITQEISLMKNAKDPRQAYEHQSILLRDAFQN